jgi:hypothetical protein
LSAPSVELVARITALEDQIQRLTIGVYGLLEALEGLAEAEQVRLLKLAALEGVLNGESPDEVLGEIGRILTTRTTAH